MAGILAAACFVICPVHTALEAECLFCVWFLKKIFFFFRGIHRGILWEIASVKWESNYPCYLILRQRDYTVRIPALRWECRGRREKSFRRELRKLYSLQNLWCEWSVAQSTELIHKKLERQLDQCQAGREYIFKSMTSQDLRGREGLWIN